jgi:hypothetical protein
MELMASNNDCSFNTMTSHFVLLLLVCTQLLASLLTVSEIVHAVLLEVPANCTVCVGDKAVFKCLTNGNLPVNWLWCDGNCSPGSQVKHIFLKGGITMPYRDRFIVLQTAVKGQYDLQVHNVSESDSGIYTCVDEAGRSGAQRAYAHLSVIQMTTANVHHGIQVSGIDATTSVTSSDPSSSLAQTVSLLVICMLVTGVIICFFLQNYYASRQQLQRRSHHLGGMWQTIRRTVNGTEA